MTRARGLKPTPPTQSTHMRRCEVCGTSVPATGWLQHTEGRKHNSMRFYGRDGHIVHNIRLYKPDGSIERELRPKHVPERVLSCARVARELVISSKQLVAHSGVALFERACARLTPELLCAVLLRMHELEELHGSSPRLHLREATIAHVAAAAALVESPKPLLDDEIRELSISVSSVVSNESAGEAALCASLTALAQALPKLRAGAQRVEIKLGIAVQLRRFAELLVRALERSLLAATGLCELKLSASHGHLRPGDVARLEEAARRGWADREMVVLRGTHGRGESPLRLLPPNLVRDILDLVAEMSRTVVLVADEVQPGVLIYGAPAGGMANLAGPSGPHAGEDLSFVAGLV